MLRTLIGAIYAAAWITLTPGCTMPSRSADLLSRITDSQDEDDLSDELRSRRIDEFSRSEPHTDAPVASYTEPDSQQHVGLDRGTLSLIDWELRDLSASERQRWMAHLRNMDPQMVPYVLQARRMQVDATRSMQHELHDSEIQQFPGTHQAPVPGGIVAQTPVGTGGTMSQMQLDAPEPAGTPIAATPFAGQPGQYAPHTPPSSEYVYGGDPRMPVAQTNHEITGPLPRISPGTYERVADPGVHDSTITATNFEAVVDSRARPVSSGQDAYLLEELQRVIALTEAEIAASNPGYSEQERMDYIRRHVALRMLYFMSEQPHLAQQAIPDIDPAEQEFWTELFWSVSNYFDVITIPDPAERSALVVAQLASASRHLRHHARLELWNTSFCHKINSFGNFERYDRDEFRAGQQVALYAELRNFHSEPTTTGHFRTLLKSHIEIRRGGIDGERVENGYNTFAPTEDLCRAPRNDYYHSYKIDLPHHLTPGPHALVLTVEDTLSGKVATEVLDFVVR